MDLDCLLCHLFKTRNCLQITQYLLYIICIYIYIFIFEHINIYICAYIFIYMSIYGEQGEREVLV